MRRVEYGEGGVVEYWGAWGTGSKGRVEHMEYWGGGPATQWLTVPASTYP